MKSVDHDDRGAPESLGQQRRLYVGPVLVAVADDEGPRRVHQGEGDQQLGLAAGFESHLARRSVLDDLLHYVSLLIHLDRVDAPMAALVVVFPDGLIKGIAETPDAMGENVRKADQ